MGGLVLCQLFPRDEGILERASFNCFNPPYGIVIWPLSSIAIFDVIGWKGVFTLWM